MNSAEFVDRYGRVEHPVIGPMPFILWPFQRRVLEGLDASRFTILNIARQMGAVTMLAHHVLYRAMMHGECVVVASRNRADSKEFMARVGYAYDHLPAEVSRKIEHRNTTSMGFGYGGHIFARIASANMGRGLSMNLLVVMDADDIPRRNQPFEMWTNINPVIYSTNGRVILAGNPGERPGLFTTLWQDDSKYFARHKVTWRDHPERNKAWADAFRQTLGEAKFRREHGCEFV